MTQTQVDIEFRNVIKEFPTRGSEGALRAVDNISFTINRGEFFALLGPSGCGKTTSLRMIAGFEDPTSGDVILRGKPVQGVPPFHRPVNTVFQDYALFPHMTVVQNVMFGLEMEGVNKTEARKRAQEALEMVRLTGIDRKPRQLSGGQQQRVALARALVKQPAVLLLDEPLGALDLKLRKEMQFELAGIQNDLAITFIHVTHDQEEALTMADRIAVMNMGKVLQIGTPEEIYETPNTRFVADFIGETSFITGSLIKIENGYGYVRLKDGTTLKCGSSEREVAAGSEITVAVRPEKVNLFAMDGKVRFADGTSDSADIYKANLLKDPDINLVEGTIKYLNYIGTDTRYIIEFSGGHEVVARLQNFGLRSDTSYSIGQRVYTYFDADTTRLLVE